MTRGRQSPALPPPEDRQIEAVPAAPCGQTGATAPPRGTNERRLHEAGAERIAEYHDGLAPPRRRSAPSASMVARLSGVVQQPDG